MTDIQGALKELIMPAQSRPWVMPKSGDPKSVVAIKKVRERHKIVVSLSMAGFNNNEIAKELGYTPARISTILNSSHPGLQSHREQMARQVAKDVGDLILSFRAESKKSLDVLVEIRDSQAPASERRLSALAILDRAGYSPVKKTINLDAQVPVEELKGVIDRIEDANEVAFRRLEWQVKDVRKEA